MTETRWTFQRILKHFLFWSVYHLLNTAVFGHFHEDYLMVFISDLKILPLKVVIAYFTSYYLIPKFVLQERNYLLFFVSFLSSSIVIILISNFFIYYSIPAYDFYDPYVILKYMLYSYPVVGLVIAIKFWSYLYHHQLLQERLKKEKFEAELNMLKSQIHPHFLFNTINNIYSLALEKSEKAPVALLKLSEILTYILYECAAEKVPLSKEIDLLRNYLSLEKIRYEERLDVLFNINGATDRVMIAPLILLTFLENSFKHGVGKVTEGAWVSMDILAEENSLTVKIENSKSESVIGKKEKEKIQTSYINRGIGLNNVQRRLELIYGDRFLLELLDDRSSFLVILKINLLPSEIISEML